MIALDVPGRGSLRLEHLVLDLNGTLAVDGELVAGLAGRLGTLAAQLDVCLVSADTHGLAGALAGELGIRLWRIAPGGETAQKRAIVETLGAGGVAAVGNGSNDAGMLEAAALGIAVLGPEGLSVAALQAADLVVGRVEDALDLLLHTRRLVATLRE